MTRTKEHDIAMRVSTVSIVVNLVLSVLKFFAGIVGNSGAMISDAVHSASDVFSTFIVIIGVKISSKSSDKEHQYGHERLECVAAIILAAILLFTGVMIGIAALQKIIRGNYEELLIPSKIALVAAVVSIIVKEWLYWYTRAAAKKINSSALMADAWHHRSDALSSIGSFAGIFGSRLGYPVLDSVASVLISLFIAKAAYEVFKEAVDKMIDKACDEEILDEMRKTILKQRGVLGIDLLKTRLFGSKIYVDIEISADGKQTLNDSHHIAEHVHDAIENDFDSVKHCMVHVNPK